jgi:hypothetical protein
VNRAFGFFAFLVLAAASFAQDASASGEEAVAARYLSYARAAAGEGRWADAETVLERASDFASASSDLSLGLAEARRKLGRPLGSVLEAARRALEAGRWTYGSPDEARLLEAECLLDLRLYDEALSVLSKSAAGPETELLRLRALRGSGDPARYALRMKDALGAYPRDPRFAALLFRSVGKRPKSSEELRLATLAVSRLPFLLDQDPFLAVLAAPFVPDPEERRRLVAAYRAVPPSDAASLPAALDLGLVEENDAVDELFAREVLDHRLIEEVYSLLRSESARERFRSSLAEFSGVVFDDAEGDGRREAETRYAKGAIVSFDYDADQDGLPEWSIRFSAGLPVSADVVISTSEPDSDRVYGSASLPARPVQETEIAKAEISWERYPYVAAVRLGDRLFGFPPAGFPFAPVRLAPIAPSSETRFPAVDARMPRLTERSLFSFASSLERPGGLAPGSVERIEYSGGTPLRSFETLAGRQIARTDYEAGFPLLRRVDFDQDGRFETAERYRKRSFELESVETDFDGDGVFEKERIK